VNSLVVSSRFVEEPGGFLILLDVAHSPQAFVHSLGPPWNTHPWREEQLLFVLFTL
jgi:hypothetical protein